MFDVTCFIHGETCPYDAKCNNPYRQKGEMRPFGRIIRRHKRAQRRSNKNNESVCIPDKYGMPTTKYCVPDTWKVDNQVCHKCFCMPVNKECFCGHIKS